MLSREAQEISRFDEQDPGKASGLEAASIVRARGRRGLKQGIIV